MAFVTVSVATLPSIPLDFAGNCERIKQSIRLAKAAGAKLRTGPELEICGYGCLDHHLEGDTSKHSWEIVVDIISDPICKDMVIDLGLPVRHRNVRYNCRVLCTFRHIYFIRPKMSLAQDGLYREARHFTAWCKPRVTENYYLESILREATGQHTVPFGDAILSTRDTAVSVETCEELFTPSNPSTALGLNGCEIILNSSASHAELRKLETRLNLITNSVRRLGGLYLYANAIGVDGEARMMFDGSSMVILNGKVLGQSPQFTLKQVEILTATIDLEEIRSFRSSISRNVQAAAQPDFPRIESDLTLSRPATEIYLSDTLSLSKEITLKYLDPMEEIHMAQAVYLWQYLVRTNSPGYFLSLSGGLDSSTVALFIAGMCKVVIDSIDNGDKQTLADLRRVTGEDKFHPKDFKDIVKRILHTCYQGTVNSSSETRDRAAKLSAALGAYHTDINIDEAVQAQESIVQKALDFTPRYSVHGGTRAENLAKQNMQARSRLVVQYSLAALSTSARGTPRAGAALLVATSGNVDDFPTSRLGTELMVYRNLRGYYTKADDSITAWSWYQLSAKIVSITYDASSGDIAPLGSISKIDAKAFQEWARDKWALPIMNEFIHATPTAELLPLSAGVQDDESEEEMGLSYAELSTFGILRKIEKLGPWSTYLKLLSMWPERRPLQIAEKTMRFYRFYAINRHKATIITPSIHLSGYNPDDNRHDLRPFLYVVNWPYQFGKIREHADELERKKNDT